MPIRFVPTAPEVDCHAILQDPKIEAVLDRCYREWAAQRRGLIFHFLPQLHRLLFKQKMDWQKMFGITKDLYLPLEAEQGGLLYVAARAIGARRVVEYGTSFGVSTLYLAAAVRDNGGGTVIGTEILPEKAEVARSNFKEAGVDEFIDLRVGDARETLEDCGGEVDLVLLDGWKDIELDVLKTIEPQLRRGALVFTDNVHTFEADNHEQREYMADPRNGYRAVVLPVKDGMEVAVYTGRE
ncbi:MAG: class I SAM-dependent methyltransferase [Myxococcota bacterium]|jgi:predicted O-methyltransferase YrrM|nr:class I SAM-dependent methyltransferase [Myxococcota bacterium]